ncbi:MAG: glycosyltransferase family 1 protein [Desulfobacterales bacterium]|nr:glycosyltransferase family 1 protein [Desulfobacterales bacterium]
MNLSNSQLLTGLLDSLHSEDYRNILPLVGNNIELLLTASNYAIKQGMIKEAKILLEIAEDSLIDINQKNSVNSILGTLCFNERDFNSARKYYSRLPLNESNFSKYIKTFVEQGDLDGLSKVCEDLSGLLENPNFKNIIQKAIYEINLDYIKKIDHRAYNQLSLLGFPDNNYENNIKLDFNPTGEFSAPNNDKKDLNAFLILCKSIHSIRRFLNGIYTDTPFFLKRIFYVFTDFNILNVSLSLFHFSILTKCDYVFRIFDINDFEIQFREVFFQQNIYFSIITHFFMDESEKKFFYEQINPFFKKLDMESDILVEFYKNKLIEFYPANFCSNIPKKIKSNSLKILFITSRFTTFLRYCTRDLADAFESIKVKVKILIEKEDEPAGLRRDITYKNIYEFSPDIIFCIDHLRYEEGLPKTIPFITWIQDLLDNIFEIKDENLLSETDFLYCSSSLWQKQLLDLPAYKNKKIDILPHLLNQRIYYPIDCVKKYDVTYVAHLNIPQLCWAAYTDSPDSSLSEEELIYRKLIRYLELKPLKSLTRYYSGNDDVRIELWKEFFSFINKISPDLDKNLHIMIQNIVIAVARIKPLKSLLDNKINLRVFGNEWNRHPWFKDVAMGPVNNGPDLNRLINETKINLNINPAMSFHNKVAEVTGASAFFLTRNIGKYDLLPIDMFFKLGEEVILFEDEKDLLEKVIYYLEHEEERKEIAYRAHLRTLQEFTFDAAAKRILNDVCGSFL